MSDKINSDIYIMFSVDNKPNVKGNTDKYSCYIQEINKQSKYECCGSIATQLNREFVGEYDFACTDDEYEDCVNNAFLKKERIKSEQNIIFFSTFHESTNISILTAVIPQNSHDITFIQDQMSTGNLFIKNKDDSEFVNMDVFFKNELGVQRVDEPKCIVCMKEKPENEMLSILACEAFQSNHIHYHQTSKEIKELCENNLAQYDFYDLYASPKCVLFIFEKFEYDYTKNLEEEIAVVFICELVFMQSAAISTVNQEIIKCLSSEIKATLLDIERIYLQFGKTLVFWEPNIFKYTLAQIVFEHICQAYRNPQLLEDFNRNRTHLEHVVELKSSQASEKEGKVINGIAIFLAIVQIIPLVLNRSFVSYSILGVSGIVGFIFIMLYIVRRNREKRKKSYRRFML